MVQRLISTFQNIVRYLSLSDSDHRISYHHPGSQFGVYSYGKFHVKCSQGLGPLSRHHRCHWYASRLGGRFHYLLRLKFIIKYYLKRRTLSIMIINNSTHRGSTTWSRVWKSTSTKSFWLGRCRKYCPYCLA